MTVNVSEPASSEVLPLSEDGSPPQLTAAELENSAPFDPDKRLRGEAGAALLDEVLALLAARELEAKARRRKRKSKDADLQRRTLDTFLANLIALWLNRVDATRFLAVPFDTNAYTGWPLSLTAMQGFRDGLAVEDLIKVAKGFRKVDFYEHDKQFGRLTRIRATPSLIDLFEAHGIDRPSVRRVTERGVIHIREKDADAGPEPAEVVLSRAVIERINARLDAANIALPLEAWDRIRWQRDNEGEERDAYRAYAGDETAKVLRRSFVRSWDRGGRIYGGWWMHLPKAERLKLTIDGEAVVELDYAQLHPTLLFLRAGQPLDFDPYAIPGLDREEVRDLGKRTFQRLINRKAERQGGEIRMRAAAGDADLLPPGVAFQAYLQLFKLRLAPIAQWFGTGVGVQLQREDSDLAVDILDRMDRAGAITLPIHDSFIVQAEHGALLEETMRETFYERFGAYPGIKKAG